MQVGEVNRMRVKRAALAALDDDELMYLLASGRVANDLAYLNRLLLAHQAGRAGADRDECLAQVVLAVSALTLVAGKCWEAWLLIKHYSRLWQPDRGLLTIEQQDALAQVKSIFSNGSKIELIRQQCAFHYDKTDLAVRELALFRDTNESQDVELIVGKATGNSLYVYSAEANTFALLNKLYPDLNRDRQFDELFGLVVGAAGKMNKFISKSIAAIFRKIDSSSVEIAPVYMDGRPALEDLCFPFIVKLTEASKDHNP